MTLLDVSSSEEKKIGKKTLVKINVYFVLLRLTYE
jgi:hypothetical protein